MSSSPPGGQWLRAALAAVALVVLAYSFLVATQPLLGVVIVLVLVAALLAWRFVHTFERIADALETIADGQGDRTD